jgi:selenium metabolism protein YedF
MAELMVVDARGLACPQPVILTKKALADQSEVMVLIDEMVAYQNVKKLAENLRCTVKEERSGKEYRLRITRGDECSIAENITSREGPVVVVIASETMGRGEDMLGSVLMKGFLHALTETSAKPDVMIFFNAGVKLTTHGSEVLEDLEALSQRGVRILVCGTCLSYFDLRERLAAGSVSNMYDIAETMLGAGRLVQI